MGVTWGGYREWNFETFKFGIFSFPGYLDFSSTVRYPSMGAVALGPHCGAWCIKYGNNPCRYGELNGELYIGLPNRLESGA